MTIAVSTAQAREAQFMDLPTEIHIAIISQLSCPGRPNLKLTNRYFYELVPAPTHPQLLAAEDPIYDGEDPDTLKFLTCRDCLRLRPSYKFSDNMRKGRMGGMRSHAHKRFCLDCFVNPKPGTTRHAKGMYVEVMGEGFVLCRDCVQFGPVRAEQADKRRCAGCVEAEKRRYLLQFEIQQVDEKFLREDDSRERYQRDEVRRAESRQRVEREAVSENKPFSEEDLLIRRFWMLFRKMWRPRR